MGRWWVGLLMLLVMGVPSLPLAAAQEPVAAELSWEDPANDVQTNSTGGVRQSANSDATDHVDLVRVAITESNATHLRLTFKFRGLETYTDRASDSPTRTIEAHFNFGRTPYRFRAPEDACNTASGRVMAGAMYRLQANGLWAGGPCVVAHIDRSQTTIAYDLAKGPIVDHDRIGLRQGSALTDWRITSSISLSRYHGIGINSQPFEPAVVELVDRAPDAGVQGPFVSAIRSEEGVGSLDLTALIGRRASNGESTTLVYPMRLTNRAAESVTVTLNASSDEPSLRFRVPARLQAPANGHVEFPLIVTMEFTHEHGRTAEVHVRAQSEREAGVFAAERVYLHWLETPQPAGHHDRLYLHSAPQVSSIAVDLAAIAEPRRYAFMNTLQTDVGQGTTDEPVTAFSGGALGVQQVRTGPIQWLVRLQPALLVGLDFDRSQPIEVITAIRAGLPAQTSRVDVSLYYCARGMGDSVGPCYSGGVLIGKAGVDGGALAGNQVRSFDLRLPVEPAADELPYRDNSELILLVELTADTPQSPQPPAPRAALVVKDSTLRLPLFEYHDPIDKAFQSVGSLHLDYQGSFERRVHPGGAVRFPYRVANQGDETQTVMLAAEGTNTEWTRIDPAKVVLRPGAEARGNLDVFVPHAASAGEHAELFLVAQSESNANIVALARLRVLVVDPSEPILETHLLSEPAPPQKRTPAPTPALVLLAVLAAFAGSRRRAA